MGTEEALGWSARSRARDGCEEPTPQNVAKLKLNALIAALRGAIGDLVIVRLGDGFYIREKGETPDPSSPAQMAHLSRFGQASLWAKALLTAPPTKAAYKKARHGHLTPHNVAVSDFMIAPVIESVGLESYTGQPGELIRIVATDDLKVTQMAVAIRKVAGNPIAKGPAERSPLDDKWLYTSRTQIRPGTNMVIEATAVDLPGNRVTCKAFYYVQ